MTIKNLDKRRDRYMRDQPAVRLGGLAANLARVSSIAHEPAERQAVLDLVEESKWFIEWTAPTEAVETAARLAEIQVALSVLERDLLLDTADVATLANLAADWSAELLEMSGLLEEAA
jgi:hypothetical protein